MRYRIPLLAVPNQSFSTPVEGALYDIAIRFTGTIMAVDIARDGTQLITGERAVQNAPLLGRSAAGGNFVFTTEDEAYPNWQNFGGSCQLIFSTDLDDPLWNS